MAKKKKLNALPASSPPFGSVGSAVSGFVKRLSKKKNSGPTPPTIVNLKTWGNHPDDIKASSFFDDEGEEKEKLSLPGDEDEEKEEEFSLPDDVDVAAMGMKSRSFELMESTAASTRQQMNDQLVAMIISMKEHGFKDEDLKETVQSGICSYKVSNYKMEE
jgi:hypothetical protein